MGTIYYVRNQPIEVLACAAEHWQDSTPYNKSTAFELRGLGHRLKRDYPAAITAFRMSLELRRQISPESDFVANELNWLADTERMNNEDSAAERTYRESLRITKKNNNDESIVACTGDLALLAFGRKLWAEAESLAREALALAEKNRTTGADCE